MSLFEKIRVSNEDPKAEAAATEKISGPSLADFLRDDRKSALLGDLITSSGHEDDVELGHRLHDRAIQAEDLPRLADHYEDFAKLVERSDEVKAYITPPLIERFAKTHENFRKSISNLGGIDNTAQLLGHQALPLAVRHREQFDRVYASLKVHREHVEQENKRMKEVAKSYRINDAEFESIFSIKNVKERKEKARTVIASKMMGFQRILNKVSFGGWGRAVTHFFEKKERKLMGNAMNEEAKFLEDFAGVIAASVSENDDLRTALAEVVQGNVPPPTRRMFSFGDLGTLKDSLKMDRVIADWNKSELSKNFEVPNGRPNALSEDQKDSRRRTFIEAWKQQRLNEVRAKGGGAWSVSAEQQIIAFAGRIDPLRLDARPQPNRQRNNP